VPRHPMAPWHGPFLPDRSLTEAQHMRGVGARLPDAGPRSDRRPVRERSGAPPGGDGRSVRNREVLSGPRF
jgi:hypothetical protein